MLPYEFLLGVSLRCLLFKGQCCNRDKENDCFGYFFPKNSNPHWWLWSSKSCVLFQIAVWNCLLALIWYETLGHCMLNWYCNFCYLFYPSSKIYQFPDKTWHFLIQVFRSLFIWTYHWNIIVSNSIAVTHKLIHTSYLQDTLMIYVCSAFYVIYHVCYNDLLT